MGVQVDLVGSMGDELHEQLALAAREGPTAIEATSGAVVVLGYDDVDRLAHERAVTGVGMAMFDLLGVHDGPLRSWYGQIMFTNEGAPHDRLRRLVSRAFTPRAVEALRSDAARLADESLRPIANDGGGDLVAALTPLPMQVMCRLLGVPVARVPEFAGWTDDLSVIFGFMTPEQIAAAEASLVAFTEYVEALVEERRRAPGPDLLTGLLAAESDGARLDHEEVVALTANLLVAGHDTTASQLGCSALALLRHPGELDRLRADPDLLTSAVSETLRHEPSIPSVPRTASAEVEAGDPIPAGSLVFLCTAAANRDPARWPAPERFDVGRFADPGAARVLSFGAGPHYCLGAALARLTVEEAVRALGAVPGLELAEDPSAIPWRVVLGRSPERVTVSC